MQIAPGEVVALAGENGAGKTTLVRCIAGDIAPTAGQISLGGRPVSTTPAAAARQGVAVVWQDLALCDNLDMASNLLLGRERRRHLLSDIRIHNSAAALIEGLGIPVRDTTRSVRSLSGGQRQLVAVARAMARKPRLLLLDEPTASLGVSAAAQVEDLVASLRRQGTTVLLACHDIDQMFRLADRIVVLRHGRVVADVDPTAVHPDDVVALLSGQQLDSSARRQLTRLHGLTDSLVSADPSSSLSLILSALGAALGSERLCIHLRDGQGAGLRRLARPAARAAVGMGPAAVGPAGGPVGLAAAAEKPVIEENARTGTLGAVQPAGRAPPRSRAPGRCPCWARAGTARGHHRFQSRSPVGRSGTSSTWSPVRRATPRAPSSGTGCSTRSPRATGCWKRSGRCSRPWPGRSRSTEGLGLALQVAAPGPAGGRGGAADLSRTAGAPLCRATAAGGTSDPARRRRLGGLAGSGGQVPLSSAATDWPPAAGGRRRAIPGGDVRRAGRSTALIAGGMAPSAGATGRAGGRRARPQQCQQPDGSDATVLVEDAAHSLRLALEREEAGLAHQEAAALRRSQELQRGFLSRLSHELRTPLTAIRGYASSLLQPDVTWDGESQQRFLARIAAESARLGRLVDDLLDFSAIEAGILRLQPDWCDIPLVARGGGRLPAARGRG